MYQIKIKTMRKLKNLALALIMLVSVNQVSAQAVKTTTTAKDTKVATMKKVKATLTPDQQAAKDAAKAARKQAKMNAKAAKTAAATTTATKTATTAATTTATAVKTTATAVKTKVAPVATGADAKGRTIMTGARGGKYYINKNGNKTYVK